MSNFLGFSTAASAQTGGMCFMTPLCMIQNIQDNLHNGKYDHMHEQNNCEDVVSCRCRTDIVLGHAANQCQVKDKPWCVYVQKVSEIIRNTNYMI